LKEKLILPLAAGRGARAAIEKLRGEVMVERRRGEVALVNHRASR
jgi:hypothetical protein